jgi:hypothetical protein
VKRPKLDGFTGIIDGWLEGDREVHHKQRHTAKRVFERLRAEHAFTGGYTIVKGYLRERQRRRSTPAIRPPDGSVRRHWCATRPMITRPGRLWPPRCLWVRGYVGTVVIGCGGEVIARHPRCYDRERC